MKETKEEKEKKKKNEKCHRCGVDGAAEFSLSHSYCTICVELILSEYESRL